MDGPGERPGGIGRNRRSAIAWTVAGVALLAAVVASTADRGSSDRWTEAAAVPIVATAVATGSTGATGSSGTSERSARATAVGDDDATIPATAAPSTPPPTTAAPPTTTPGKPAIVARPIPVAPAPAPPPTDPPWWAASTHATGAGLVATDVGCAAGLDAASLDAFFTDRLGPVIGGDYQHVIDLHDGRYLWLFQDTFVDPGGSAERLDQASFVHNAALLQQGACFTLHTRGSAASPRSFEPGTGERTLEHWFWPMGGEARDGQVYQYWVRMVKDGYEPAVGDGLGWHPDGTYLAVYDAATLARLAFGPAANPGVSPVYGYAVASDGAFTYLFGNTFEQNLVREGGFGQGPHSATRMFLARVPLGQYGAPPEYRTAGGGWSADAAAAAAVSSRFWVENPMQPRYLKGQWVAATKVDGYWGEELSIDVASEPWGPWTQTVQRRLLPRHGDPLMNTYHAHLMPWLDGGALVVSVSQNARDMGRDAFPHPVRYRLQFFAEALLPPPAPLEPAHTTTTTSATTTSTTTTTTTTSTTSTSTSTTSTTVAPTSSTSTTSSTTSTSTTTAPASSTSTTSSTTTSTPAPAAEHDADTPEPRPPS